MDWADVIYNFFHGDPHKMPEEVGRLTLSQYIVLSRAKDEKGGKIKIHSRREAVRLTEFYQDKKKQLEIKEAERLYSIYTNDSVQ